MLTYGSIFYLKKGEKDSRAMTNYFHIRISLKILFSNLLENTMYLIDIFCFNFYL